MLKLIVLFCISFGASVSSAADFFTELQHTRSANVNKNQVNMSVYGGGPTIGYWAYAQVVTTGYQEAYAGPKVNFSDWFEAGIAIGGEATAKTEWKQRNAGYLRLTGDTVSFYGAYESQGNTGPWHKALINYRVTPELSAGILNQSNLGTGPRIEYALSKNVSVWGARLEDHSGSTWLVTLKTRF